MSRRSENSGQSTSLPLKEAFDYLQFYLEARISSYFGDTPFKASPPPADLKRALSDVIPAVRDADDWLLVMLALVPHLQPDFFEQLIRIQLPSGGDFPQFGGARGTNHRGMLPTGETAQFMLAGTDLKSRLGIHARLSPDAPLPKAGILSLEPVRDGEPAMSGRIILEQEWVDKLLTGREPAPQFGPGFPAKHILTEMEWADAVLSPGTAQQVDDIRAWLDHQSKIEADDNLKRKIKPGYRVLFHGPSGTGKTLTAALLGRQFGKEVYRIDLSQIVSKYIGETEKNLESVFRRAERKDWILFFDEADALFGKRTSVQSAHDKYANQEVSYLLQRVEDYAGLLILASNFKNNLDDAFIRRFHAIVHFPPPNAQERHQLWQKSMPASLPADKSVDLRELAEHYELTGAGILNVVHYAALRAHVAGSKTLTHDGLMAGIRKEFLKEEKAV